jgi:hypothetical protein
VRPTRLFKCGDDLVRENVMKQAAGFHGLQLPLVLPAITVNTGTADYYPLAGGPAVALQGRVVGPLRRGHARRKQLIGLRGKRARAAGFRRPFASRCVTTMPLFRQTVR